MNKEIADSKLMFVAELIAYLGVLILTPSIIYMAEIQFPTLVKEPSLGNSFVTLLVIVAIFAYLGILIGMPLYWIRKHWRKKENQTPN